MIRQARRDGAVVATTCGAAYLLAASGSLNGKRATISWWLKEAAQQQFPKVRWEPSRLVVRQGRIYTSGAGFSGVDLIATLLVDLGFRKEERHIRKLMALPPVRQFQSPYEIVPNERASPFEDKLDKLSQENLPHLDLPLLAQKLGMSARTVSRMFFTELKTSPGKWVQAKRLQTARSLLEATRLTISEVCYRVGYQDLASFSRLFSKTTGMAPGEYRKHLQSSSQRSTVSRP